MLFQEAKPRLTVFADINGQLLRRVKLRIIDAVGFCVSEWIGFHYVIPQNDLILQIHIIPTDYKAKGRSYFLI